MPNLVLFEDEAYRNLLPLVYWRAAWELRCGYRSLFDHVARHIPSDGISFYCRPALSAVVEERLQFPANVVPHSDSALLVNGRLLLTAPLEIHPAPAVQWDGQTPLVIHADRVLLEQLTSEVLLNAAASREILDAVPRRQFLPVPRLMRYPWDLVHANRQMLELGWEQAGCPAQLAGRIHDGAHLLNKDAIHVGPGTVVKPGAVLDAENGPIYIGEEATISPNACIEGPCFIGDGSLVQPGAVLRNGMSIGRRCKVGGELESSIIHGFSNKQHDGFLGHSYIGEWINLAADTVNSDLKNTYGTVRVAVNGVEVDSGQQFVGLTMGDHSKTGIGQMFPTGAIVGFGSNVATADFAPRFVPSFMWLNARTVCSYDVHRCLEVARRVMARRQQVLTAPEEALFLSIREQAENLEHR